MASIRQVAANFAAPGAVSPWIQLETWQAPFNATILVSLDSGAALTLSLAYVADDNGPAQDHPVVVSQATTVITVQDSGPNIPPQDGGGLGHGLAVGDFVQLLDQPSTQGTYSVATVPTVQSYTLTSLTSQTLASHMAHAYTGKVLVAGSTGDKIIGATGAGITARTAIALNSPVKALQLQATVTTTPGVARLTVIYGSRQS